MKYSKKKYELTITVCNGRHYIATHLFFDGTNSNVNEIFTDVKVYDSMYRYDIHLKKVYIPLVPRF